jgi:hypothetical protein
MGMLWNTYGYVQTKIVHDSPSREILNSIVIVFGILLELVRQIKMFNDTIMFVLFKHMWDVFHILNGVKQGDAVLPLLFNIAFECVIGRPREIDRFCSGKEQISIWSEYGGDCLFYERTLAVRVN